MNKLIYNSRYQNLHLDRANKNSMITVKLNINKNFPSNANNSVMLYKFNHGYNYIPQVWGLWDIKYGPGSNNVIKRGYGYQVNNTGVGLVFDFYYTVDATSVTLWCKFSFWNATGSGNPDPYSKGTVATFTGYIFANDRSSQNYTK